MAKGSGGLEDLLGLEALGDLVSGDIFDEPKAPAPVTDTEHDEDSDEPKPKRKPAKPADLSSITKPSDAGKRRSKPAAAAKADAEDDAGDAPDGE